MNVPQLSEKVLRRLPAILEAHRAAVEESVARRRELLRGIHSAQRSFETTDAEIAAKVKPLEQRLAAVQTEVEQLQQEIAPLQAARSAAESTRYMTIHELKAQLRATAHPELPTFHESLDALRREIGNNFGQRRGEILRMFKPHLPMQQRIVEAMDLTLDASRRADRAALEAEDLPAVLAGIRHEIVSAGIDFAED